MNMAGSLLPSEGYGTLNPQPFAGGTLQVVRLMERETYALTWKLGDETFFIAAHANGYSCKELADRMVAGNVFRAMGQREHILRCGGKAAEIETFERVFSGERLYHRFEVDLFRELPV